MPARRPACLSASAEIPRFPSLPRRVELSATPVRLRPGKLLIEVFRASNCVLIFATVGIGCRIRPNFRAKSKEAGTGGRACDAAAQPVSEEVAEAEAAIVKSDWKAAEAKLDTWLAAHPTDARALFDAGYVADAQNRLEAAAGFYRRAVEANPQSFEAHVELGLLLARQGKTI